MKGAVFPFISYHGTEAPPVGYRREIRKGQLFSRAGLFAAMGGASSGVCKTYPQFLDPLQSPVRRLCDKVHHGDVDIFIHRIFLKTNFANLVSSGNNANNWRND